MSEGGAPDRVAEAPAPRRPRRWLRRLAIALGVAALLAAGLRVALPTLLARGLERGARRALDLPLRVGDVGLGLLLGKLELRDLALGRAGAASTADPVLQVRRIAAQIAWTDLLRGRVHLRELAVEDPVVRLARRADGTLESPLPPAAAEEAPPAEPAGEPWAYAVDHLRLAGLDLALAQAGREGEPVGFSLEELSLADVALRGEELTLGAVNLRGPRLRVPRDLVFPARPAGEAPAPGPAATPAEPAPPAPPTEATTAAPPPAGSEGPRYRLERVEIERAGFALLTEGEPLELELDLRAEGVTAAAGETFPLALALRVGGGEVGADGRVGLAPPSFQGKLHWAALPLPLFVLAVRPDLVPWVRSCQAEGDLELGVRLAPGPGADEPAAVRVAGRVAIHDLAIGDPKEQEVDLRWKALEAAVGNASLPLGGGPEPIRVALDRVRLEAPALRYRRPTPALAALLGGAPSEAGGAAVAEAGGAALAEPAPAPETGAAPGIELTVGALAVARGTLRFEDGTLEAPFRGAIRDLSLTARELRWPALRARRVRVRGVAPESAPFSLEGDLDGARGTFAFALQRLDLPRFDAYATGAGYRLMRGEASLQTALRVEPERYVTENELLLHDLRVDAADAGAFERQLGTPLDLALALLRDPAGDIRLPLPIAVEREELRLGRGAAVLGAVRAALIGVVSSPLKAFGAALPGAGKGEVDLAALPAAPGAAEPTAEGAERLEALATLLASRPLLAVSLRGRSGPDDRLPLAERWLEERAAAGGALPEVEGAGFLARRRVGQALASRSRGEETALSDEDQALLEARREATTVPPERFAALANARAAGVRERLVARGLDAARLVLAEPAAEGAPGVAVELAARVEPGA
jgi:hypothetical protein